MPNSSYHTRAKPIIANGWVVWVVHEEAVLMIKRRFISAPEGKAGFTTSYSHLKQRLYISAVLSLDIECYLLLVYKRETSDSRTNSRYEIKVRLENFNFCAVRFFWLIKTGLWKTANVITDERGIRMISESSAKLSTNCWCWRIFFFL